MNILLQSDDMTVFFTSDTHYDHRGALRFRPQFQSLDQMNNHITERWNSVVGKGDTVYHLGDFGFDERRFKYWLNKLNGQVHLILGNHDPEWPCNKIKDIGFASIRESRYIKVEGVKIYLHHYACRTWRSSVHGSYHLYGHSHGDIDDYNRSTDVGVDAWNFYPVPFKKIHARLSERPVTNHHK